MAISSTDCRARVADGEPVWYLVPDGVVQYINKYRLYADPTGTAPPVHSDHHPQGAPPSVDTQTHSQKDHVLLPQGDS